MLILATAMLVVVGLLAVYSAGFPIGQADYGDTNYFVARQAAYAMMGLLAMSIFMQLDYRRLHSLSIIMMFIALAALLAVLIPGIGVEQNGARRWLSLGPLPPLQPSEFAKLAIIVYIAFWLASRGDDVKRFSMGFLPFALMVSLVASLVIVEPDMGTTIIIVLTTSTLFFIAGASLTHLGLLVVGGGLITTALIWVADYRWQRILNFLGPSDDPQGADYHVRQLLIAMGSGGPTGIGWGESRGKFGYIPGSHTDGVFAIIGEELGFIGAVAVIALFAFFVYRGLRTVLHSPDRFGALVGVGIVSWIAYQALINVGGITRSIPLTGVPLPFISYGGSSIMATLMGVGILLSVSRYGRDKGYVERRTTRGRWNLHRVTT